MRVATDRTFETLYAAHYRRLYGFARWAYGAADADDIAQEAMVRAYASFARLDPDRDPWPWLVAIARNVARDRYARAGAVPVAEVPVTTGDATAAVEERAVVHAALRRLSAADRDVLVLREWHELSFGELSRLLGRSPNTLRQQVFRARRRLAEAYTALGGRAVGVVACLRWRAGGAAAQVAAAVVTGAVLAAGPAATPQLPERPPERPGVAAGPAVHGGTPAGPTARGTRPPRPLLPPRVAPPSVPAAGGPRRSAPARPPGTAAAPSAGPSVRLRADRGGHEQGGHPAGGDGALCALTALCALRR